MNSNIEEDRPIVGSLYINKATPNDVLICLSSGLRYEGGFWYRMYRLKDLRFVGAYWSMNLLERFG